MCSVLFLTLGCCSPSAVPLGAGRWGAALRNCLCLKDVFLQPVYPVSRRVDFFSGQGGLTYGVKPT